MSIKKYVDKILINKDEKILVTGCTAGIGLELIKHLAYKDVHIVMLIRNLKKGEGVIEELKKINPSVKVEMVKYDQSDYESIDSAFEVIKAKHSDFSSIVLNAGILYPPKGALSKQGHPLTIETNFLGLRYFMDKLIPLFKDKRYVMQGSLVAGFKIRKDADIYNGEYKMFDQYNISKSCVEALYHYYYINNKDNTFILTEPGIVATGLFDGFNWFLRNVGGLFMKIFSHSARKASLTLLKALDKDSKNGDYYVPRGIYTISGYPKNKKFPPKRKREFLINQ